MGAVLWGTLRQQRTRGATGRFRPTRLLLNSSGVPHKIHWRGLPTLHRSSPPSNRYSLGRIKEVKGCNGGGWGADVRHRAPAIFRQANRDAIRRHAKTVHMRCSSPELGSHWDAANLPGLQAWGGEGLVRTRPDSLHGSRYPVVQSTHRVDPQFTYSVQPMSETTKDGALLK